MKQTIDLWDFRDAFVRMDRKENFSHEGLRHLFEYLEELDREGEEEYELDVIALCCEYAEDNVDEVLEAYGLGSIEELHEKTVVVWHGQQEARVLYAQF
jgi:hypothetical protein